VHKSQYTSTATTETPVHCCLNLGGPFVSASPVSKLNLFPRWRDHRRFSIGPKPRRLIGWRSSFVWYQSTNLQRSKSILPSSTFNPVTSIRPSAVMNAYNSHKCVCRLPRLKDFHCGFRKQDICIARHLTEHLRSAGDIAMHFSRSGANVPVA
jgi:hypothetical protein